MCEASALLFSVVLMCPSSSPRVVDSRVQPSMNLRECWCDRSFSGTLHKSLAGLRRRSSALESLRSLRCGGLCLGTTSVATLWSVWRTERQRERSLAFLHVERDHRHPDVPDPMPKAASHAAQHSGVMTTDT